MAKTVRGNELERRFLETLHQTYNDAEDTILKTKKPQNNQTVDNSMLSITDIDNILLNNMKAVLSVAVYDLRVNTINITASVTSEYYYEFIPEMIPKIAYGVVSITSSYILSQIQLYMSKAFIFAYIKERIVRPHIKAEIDILLQDILKDSVIKANARSYKEMQTDIYNMMYELMIAYDRNKFVSILSKYMGNKDISQAITDILNDCDIFVPNFIYDIFNGNIRDINDLNAKLDAFFREYYNSNTNDAITNLFKQYSNKTVGFVNIAKKTIKERAEYHGLTNLSLIDGVTFVIVKIINKIIALVELSEEEEKLIADDPIATSIKNIVDKYKAYGITFMISNSAITIKDINNKETVIPYRENADVANMDNPYTVFGVDAKRIEDTFRTNPDSSPLTQTGVTKDEEKSMFLQNKSIKNMFSSMNARVSHRRRKIAELKARYAKETGLMTEVDTLMGGTTKCKYMDIYKTSTYILPDDRKLLLTLAEIEGLYRKVENYKKEASK